MPGFFEFGRFRLYPSEGRLERDGAAVAIEPPDLKLLATLAEKGAEGARREDLRQTLSPGADTRELRTRVSNLRNIIGKNAIETGPCLNYVFRAPVEWVDERSANTKRGAQRARLWLGLLAGLLITGALAYWALRRQREPLPAQDWRVTPVTSTAGSEALAAFFPAGDRMAFCWNGEDDGAFQIYIRNENSGEIRAFTADPQFHHYSPSWSPDGANIAFVRVGRGTAEFCVGPVDGSRPPVCGIRSYPGRAEVPGRQLDWSADGKYLAVVDKASLGEPFRISRVEMKGGAIADGKRPLTQPQGSVVGDSSPSLSPDGSTLVFVRVFNQGMRDLFALNLRTGEESRLTNDNRYVAGVSWMPDSAEVVFSSNRGGGLRLWRMQVASPPGDPVPIGPLVNAVHPAVSPAGAVVYSEFQVDTDMLRLDLTTRRLSSTPFNSTLQDSTPNVGPDGRIAFASDRSGSFEIWITDRDGRSAEQLTSAGGLGAGSGRWSPDGNRIAFDSRMSGNPDIYIIDARPGAQPKRVTTYTGEDVVPSWSRDGKHIYFSSTRAGGPRHEIWKLPADGNEANARQITFGGGFAPFESFDGKYVYYARSRSQPGLMRVPAEGGQEEPVLNAPPAGFWSYWALSRDGIYYLEPGASGTQGPGFGFAMDFISPLTGSTIKFMRFDTQASEEVAVLEHHRLAYLPGLALSHDGKSLFLPGVERSEADLKKLENY